MKSIAGWIAGLFRVEAKSFERWWDTVAAAVTGIGILVAVALLYEPKMTGAYGQKIAMALAVSTLAAGFSTRPKMVLVVGLILRVSDR